MGDGTIRVLPEHVGTSGCDLVRSQKTVRWCSIVFNIFINKSLKVSKFFDILWIMSN